MAENKTGDLLADALLHDRRRKSKESLQRLCEYLNIDTNQDEIFIWLEIGIKLGTQHEAYSGTNKVGRPKRGAFSSLGAAQLKIIENVKKNQSSGTATDESALSEICARISSNTATPDEVKYFSGKRRLTILTTISRTRTKQEKCISELRKDLHLTHENKPQ